MVITELTYYESDFVTQATRNTGAYQVRTFDMNHLTSVFVYYFEDYIHLGIRRYKHEDTTVDDWAALESVGILYPGLILTEPMDIWFNPDESQIHVKIPNSINERRL